MLSEEQISALKAAYPNALFISTRTGFGLDGLREYIASAASASEKLMDVLIPYSQGDLVSLAHEKCRIVKEEYGEEGTRLSLFVGNNLASRFEAFQI